MFNRLTSFLGGRISFKFFMISSLTISVIFVMVFLFIAHLQEKHIMEQVRKQATILHKQVVLTRAWVADHGCILVKKTPGVKSSAFLPRPDLEDKDGVTYTRITPAILTKQLSDKAGKSDSYSFKITNANPLNPDNKPDRFETEALKLFKSSQKDGIFRIEFRDGKETLRYVAPLYVSSTCLGCHMVDGHKPGDVGGCLSVFVPMDDARSAINQETATLLVGGVVFAGLLVMLLFVATRALVFKRIGDIRATLSGASDGTSDGVALAEGDELKEIADFCYLLNEKLQDQRKELERKIGEATRDLSGTNTSLEAANRELIRLNKAKSDFFSDISHELRTPLTSIKGAADIVARKGLCEDPAYIDIIRRNADHLIKAMVDFLDYSKIEAGQLELHTERSSLHDVATDAMLSQRAQADDKGINLLLDASKDSYTDFDRQRIYQVMTNLLSNAVKFSPDRGDIVLRIISENGMINVCVEDEGPGLEAEYHEAVFEKFYQTPDTKGAAIHKGSSGIGLAICKGIVEAHRGSIWVESEPGKGSRFFFSLPVRGVS